MVDTSRQNLPQGGAQATETTDELLQVRLAKAEKLREAGVDLYPARFKRSHTSAEALAAFDSLGESPVTVAGRIVARRVMGRASFCHIQDGAGRIQIYLKQDLVSPEKYAEFRDLYDIGDHIGATGRLFRTKTGEITVEVGELTMLSKSLRPLPEKWHGLSDVEARFRQRYLDLIANPEARQVFQVRSKIITAMRRFLDEHGFIEVETPVLQALYGGATARPFKTFYNALDREFYLRIATELYLKRLIVGGMDKVYEIGRVFRNEGVDIKHNPEFTLLETYEAYADYNDVMDMVEQMIPFIAEQALGTRIIERGDQSIDLTPPWRRVSIRQIIRDESGVDFEEYPDQADLYARVKDMGLPIEPRSPRAKIIDELLSRFVEPKLIQPTFITDYPVELSPLAKKRADNPRLVERFEAYAGGYELANAFSELNDPVDQRARFEGQLEALAAGDEEAHQMDEDYILALEHGMPPTGGLGVGSDRLTMFLTGQDSLREVILFPQLRTRE